jgi:ribonuclease HII
MICGIDEAGRGPVIGPLVIAGVCSIDDSKLKEINVRDSKKCTPQRRELLAKKIVQIAGAYEILVIPAEAIDDMRKVMTINDIEVNAFVKVINKLKPQICYVDSADVNEGRFARDILKGLTYKPDIISKHKADDIFPIVSAASILAKTRRDEEIRIIAQELENKLGLPLGSGYPADPITQKFFKTWFEKFSKFPPHTRKSWKTSEKILRDNHTKKLDDF